MSKKNTFIGIRIREDSYNILKEEKEKTGIPLSELLRLAVKEKYRKEQK